ncbi:MAG: GFA family protein [Marinagarivorans sp.]|nr:GFA family protein [Marinagarivorans sp.]
MHKGSCLCGAVSFELNSEPKSATHCHCKMCQKQHGAAFATYASVPIADLHYLSGLAQLSVYKSSGSIERKFCSICGSNIEWRGSKHYSDWVSIAVATLDTPFNPKNIKQIHMQSKVCWLENN